MTSTSDDRCPPPVRVQEPAPGGMALLIIDMVSNWDFPDGEKLVCGARAAAPAIAALRDRCRAARVPVIYANDNNGDWQADFGRLIERSRARGAAGADVTGAIAPADGDYFVLKPKHSAFYATPMDVLLRHLEVRHVILTGVSSDQCVLATAAEARMRDFHVTVARNGVGSQTVERNRVALHSYEEVHKLNVVAAEEIELPLAA